MLMMLYRAEIINSYKNEWTRIVLRRECIYISYRRTDNIFARANNKFTNTGLSLSTKNEYFDMMT